MERKVALIYLSSWYIEHFITMQRVEWRDRSLARLGGVGDQAGVTPTPAVYEFLALLAEGERLFTQEEYTRHCFSVWKDWIRDKWAYREGIEAKLYNNFYPSMVDSLYVWAMLSEVGWFDRCLLDSYQDAVGKVDLTLGHGETEVYVALLGPTRRAEEYRRYKLANRGGQSMGVHEVRIPMSRSREPGNKRWFEIGDFEFLNPAHSG